MKKIVISIDGYSSCGKSTMAKDLASRIGYTFVDTGAMYRAVTLLAIRNNLFDENNKPDTESLKRLLPDSTITQRHNPSLGKAETFLNGENIENEIRGMEVSSLVSAIATIPFVRSELVRQQQVMGKDGGIVMDGRDIGTTVFPNAELKIFVTAYPQIRAQRRYAELLAKGQQTTKEEVLKNLEERDFVDSHREVSPLRQAEDAVVIDNTNLSPSEQLAMLLALYKERIKRLA